MEELGFSVAEINQAFKDLVKEYKSSTEYKKAQDRFDGYLYCAYTFRGRGASAYTTYIFKNGVTAQTALKPIESVNRDSVFTSSTRVSTQKNQEIAETITESQSQPLKPIESVNRNSVFTSSMRTSGGKVHPYRDINNIYILSLDQEKESVEQMNQNMKLPQDTPPTPPPLVRKRNGIKGTEMSCFPADPWMVSADNPKPEFANWVLEQNKRKRPEATLPDAKAEIRNNYVRAGDLWLEFQKAIALDEKLALEKLALESRPQLEPEPQPQPVAFDHKAARLAIVRKINQTT
jgi:hypothetical protein